MRIARAQAWSAGLCRFWGSREPALAPSAVPARRPAQRSVSPRRPTMAVRSASAVERFLPRTGLVAQIRPEPALDLLQRHPLARGVVLDLVSPEPADREVARERMGEVDPAHRRC